MLDHPVSIIFGHVAARGNGLVVWGIISEGNRGSVEIIGTRCILKKRSICMTRRETDKMLTFFSPLHAASLQKPGWLLGLLGFAGMSRSRRRGNGARLKVEDGVEPVEDIVLASELTSIIQRQIGS